MDTEIKMVLETKLEKAAFEEHLAATERYIANALLLFKSSHAIST